MPSIHFVERIGNTWKVPNPTMQHEYESGYWVVGEETAQKLVGGDLYLHDRQNEPSRFGGKILGYRVHKGGTEDGRVIFRFQATSNHRDLKTPREGWGNEKKIVW
ncbi:MAG: hypothetical protein RLZZ352_2057 [Pseudomonadota bacterium]|jgi:hypothetical protein